MAVFDDRSVHLRRVGNEATYVHYAIGLCPMANSGQGCRPSGGIYSFFGHDCKGDGRMFRGQRRFINGVYGQRKKPACGRLKRRTGLWVWANGPSNIT
jgi:hypothetical protein